MVKPFAWSSGMAMVSIAIPLRQPLSNGLVEGTDKGFYFIFVNWSRNKLISKSNDYSLVIYTISQQFDPPNDGITSHPFIIAQRAVSSPHLSPFAATNFWLGPSREVATTWQECCWHLCSRCQAPCWPTVVAAAVACWQWRRQRCLQCGNKVNKDNNNNMTTTQQPTWQPIKQPTWRGNNCAARKKLCSKLCFFSVSRYVLTPGQCDASQTFKGTFLCRKGMFSCFYVKKIVPVDTALSWLVVIFPSGLWQAIGWRTDLGVKWPCLNRDPEAGSVVAVSTKYSILG